MYHRFPDFYYALSDRLYNILDGVGYSQNDRHRNVRNATECEVFRNIQLNISKSSLRMHIFGSRGEGSTGPGLNSDIDYLYQYNELKIITDLSDCEAGELYLYMLDDGYTHPGYVKLQLITILSDNTPIPLDDYNCTLDSFGVLVLPNTYFHMNNFGFRHGPATRQQEMYISCDRVLAFRGSKWPNMGYEWFYRRRFYDWPKTSQIQNTWKYGCFASPVGHLSSNEEDLEWRLSFSLAERDLVRSFEDTVMKVYILLKMVKKTFIEPVLKDAFSSYHCKVCMLWMREKTPSKLWCTENLLCCLILCIRQLYEWAIAGFCPDYFIVRNNIYDRKIVGIARIKLIRILERLLSDDCRFLCWIEFCHIGRILVDDLSSFEHYRFELASAVINEEIFKYSLCVSYATFCWNFMIKTVSQNYQSLTYYLTRFADASKHAPFVMQYPLKHIAMILFSQLGFYFASVLKVYAGQLSWANVEHLVSLTSECLSLGMNSDATSVRLKLCGLGIVLEYNDLTEICLQDICENRMRYMFSSSLNDTCGFIVFKCNQLEFLEKCLNGRDTIEDVLENQVSFSVVYLQSEISITPIPLRMEMYRSVGVPLGIRDKEDHFWYGWAVVDSLVCLHFFQYLNFIQQGKDRHKQVALDNMINVIQTESDIPHKDTALNLIAYCYVQNYQPRNAFICLRESIKICPHHNAAKFYLGILFKRVVAVCTKPSMY
ncbi:hypothetical protein CHS0354_002625 [Potamilus streckersoni]|uniref:Mab-21-like HhH/H2TH-like domain-containing protein n=1 Tax=Potamilus streckersoni TaxID=2493646 RepID=A0AAE0RNK0_9BIVA|nr:hypothetical protein CHS0354_002625 [Potamilus streckersoni]